MPALTRIPGYLGPRRKILRLYKKGDLMKRYLLSILLITAFAGNAFCQQLTAMITPVFKVGEQLNYKLKYGFFTAAEADLRVEASDKTFDGHPVYHIVADGKTAGAFDILYKVRNRYE